MPKVWYPLEATDETIEPRLDLGIWALLVVMRHLVLKLVGGADRPKSFSYHHSITNVRTPTVGGVWSCQWFNRF